MASEIKAFKCDFCSRCFGRINNARTHEAACKNNPARRQCITCIHGTMDAIHVERAHASSCFSYTYHSAPYCAHHNNTPIHEKPYFIECDSDDGGGWYEERPLPGTCHHYEYKGKPGWTKREREETEEERVKITWP